MVSNYYIQGVIIILFIVGFVLGLTLGVIIGGVGFLIYLIDR